jgi:hypothetical protein
MLDKTLNIIKDVNDQKLHFHTRQECGGVLDANREDRNNGVKDLSFGRKFASVPTAVLDAWKLHEGIDYTKIGKDPDMRKRFLAKLNSREWNGFRTHTGNL